VLVADADLYAPQALMRVWAAHIKHHDWVVIDDAGHSVAWEKPRRVQCGGAALRPRPLTIPDTDHALVADDNLTYDATARISRVRVTLPRPARIEFPNQRLDRR